MHIDASPLLIFGFIVLTLVVCVGWLVGVWLACRTTGMSDGDASRTLVAVGGLTIAWLVTTLVLAATHLLLHFDWRPPAMIVLLAVSLGLAGWIAASRLGGRLSQLPLLLLVGFQAFRWPLEAMLHRGFVEGFVPAQMTYIGWNFDVLTGVSAAALGVWGLRATVPRALVFAWNVAGTVLLINAVAIAVMSMPNIRAFGPDRLDVWVALPPFVWLPSVLVVAAAAGHVVIFRALAARAISREAR